MSNHVTQERHDCKMVLNKSKLNIEADIFVDIASCVVWFCTEDWTHLEDTLKDPHHSLLVKLRTLRQERWPPKVVQLKDCGTAFGGSGVWYLVGLGASALLFSLLLPRGIWGTLQDRFGLRLMPVGYRLRFSDSAPPLPVDELDS